MCVTFWLCNLQIFILWAMQFLQSCSNSTGGNPDHFIGQCHRIQGNNNNNTFPGLDSAMTSLPRGRSSALHGQCSHPTHQYELCLCTHLCVCMCGDRRGYVGCVSKCVLLCVYLCMWHVWVNSGDTHWDIPGVATSDVLGYMKNNMKNSSNTLSTDPLRKMNLCLLQYGHSFCYTASYGVGMAREWG